MTSQPTPARRHLSPTGRRAAWIGVIWALATWSYLEVWATNIQDLPSFHFRPFATWTVAFAVTGTIVAIGALRWFRASTNVAGALGVTTTIAVQSVNRVPLIPDETGPLRAGVAVALLLVVGATTVVVARRVSLIKPALVIAIALLSVPLAELSYDVARREPDSPGRDAGAPLPVTESELAGDLYVIVLDAYARSDVLEREFGFDNSTFEDALANHGITIADRAMSNYTITQISVPSLLDGTHLVTGVSTDPGLLRLREVYAGDNTLFKLAHQTGREIHMFDNAWTFTRCGAIVDDCVTATASELDFAIAQRTPVPFFSDRWRINPWVTSSVDQLRSAVDVARAGGDRPRLVFLHSLIPHSPFQLDADCNPYWDGRLDGYLFEGEDPSNVGIRRTAYIDQLECTNRLVLDLVAAIPPDSSVLIAGDHGARPTELDEAATIESAAQVDGQFGTFVAYRFPTCPPIDNDATLVAIGDALHRCLGAVESQPLGTPRWFVTRKAPGDTWDVTDVTATVRSFR